MCTEIQQIEETVYVSAGIGHMLKFRRPRQNKCRATSQLA